MEYNPFITKICRWFSKESSEVYLLTSDSSYFFSDQKEGPREPRFEYTIMNRISNRLGMERDLSFFGYLCRALTEGKKFDPDLIFYIGYFAYFNSFVANFVSKILNVPCVGDWIGTDLLQGDDLFEKHLKRYFLRANTLNLVQSRHMKKKVDDLADTAKVAISPDKGIDLNLFRPRKGNIDHENLEKNVKILYVGRLNEIKGLDYLVKSFKEINQNYPRSRLQLVGDGPTKDDLKREIDDLGVNDSVEFKGHVEYEELPDHYVSADIFILPSISEGLSNVLMEAMACGLPVVATDVGGNRELIKEERGGYLVAPKSSSELVERIEKLIENPELREEMGYFNRRYVERYEQEKILREKSELLENLLDDHLKEEG